MSGGLLIDVRDTDEYTEYHAPGAVHLPLTAIACGNIGILTQTAKDERIGLYCRSGARSERARTLLLDLGFTHVINIGGLDDVKNAPDWNRPISPHIDSP